MISKRCKTFNEVTLVLVLCPHPVCLHTVFCSCILRVQCTLHKSVLMNSYFDEHLSRISSLFTKNITILQNIMSHGPIICLLKQMSAFSNDKLPIIHVVSSGLNLMRLNAFFFSGSLGY